jgi:hypothetical protein
MKRHTALFITTVVLAVVSAASSLAREDTGCITCHSDEQKIKSLYIPPKIEFKKEEGEG